MNSLCVLWGLGVQILPWRTPCLAAGRTPSMPPRTRQRPLEQQRPFALVARESRRAPELRFGLVPAPQLEQQVAAHAGQEVVAAQCGLVGERVDDLESR